MDVENLSLRDLLLSGISHEAHAKAVYERIARRVQNFLLRDRLRFLAAEEDKHREVLTAIFKHTCPENEVVLLENPPVPLPEINCSEETAISEVLTQAMEAEKAAYDFYTRLVPRLPPEDNLRRMVNYLARMELGHYNLLRSERDSADDLEQADDVWPMFHIGP